MAHRQASIAVVGAVALAAVLAGCSSDDGGAIKPPATSRTTTSTSTSTSAGTGTGGPTTAARGGFAGQTTRTSVPAPEGAPRLLAAVRVASQGTYDRVVFEFRGDVPGYVAEYVAKPVRQDGSGEPIAVAGAAALEVRMTPAAGVDLTTGDATPTYTGPNRLPGTGGGGVVAEVVRAGDFEGVITWAIGVRPGKAPFRVTTLTGPPRVVIDVGR